MYQVFINEQEIPLEEITVSHHPFNRVWPGKQRDPAQGQTAYMLRIWGTGARKFTVVAKQPVRDAVVRPLSKNVSSEINGCTVSFTIPTNGKYSIELDGVQHAIHLLYQKPMDHSTKPRATYHFESGHHHVGLLTLKSGDSVYIAPDAVVHASLYAVDASDIFIYGGGILCGDWENRTERHGDLGFDGENSFSPERVHTYGGIRTYRCKNISVQGITVTDTASYGISFFATDGITLDDVNVLGLWKYNCDGIDFINSANITVKDCFIRSFDDCMCMKGLTAFSDMNMENALITNTVFWCDWGKNMDIGLATASPEIKNIQWKDCDIIHNSNSCITISNGQWADAHDITFQNIHIEYSKYTEKPVLQIDDQQTYEGSGKPHIPALISISDQRRTWQGNISYPDTRTKIRDILIDHIHVVMDAEIQGLPPIHLNKTTEESTFRNIIMENIFINGKKLDTGF